MEQSSRKRLGEDVCNLALCRDVLELDILGIDELSKAGDVRSHMAELLDGYAGIGEKDGSLIVAEDCGSTPGAEAEELHTIIVGLAGDCSFGSCMIFTLANRKWSE